MFLIPDPYPVGKETKSNCVKDGPLEENYGKTRTQVEIFMFV